MITVFNSQPGWGAAPPPLITPATLTIPNDFAPMVWPDPGVKPDWWPINPMQQAALCSWAQMLLFGGQSGGGKLLDLDTPLATPTGWTTVREVKVGDRIFDELGRQTAVTYISPVEIGDSYRLTFDDGSELVADAAHRWFTTTAYERYALWARTGDRRAYRRSRRPSRALTNPAKPGVQKSVTALNRTSFYEYEEPLHGAIRNTSEIGKTLVAATGATNHSITVAAPLELQEAVLPMHPYLLGAWLGDGSKNGGGFTGIDPQIWEEIERLGYRISHSKKDHQHHHIQGIAGTLRSLGVLNDKHLPEMYLRGSIEQRLAVMQGLMDTDGNCTKSGQCEFDNTNWRIIQGAYELALSLGIKTTIQTGTAKLDGRTIGPKWRLKFVTQLPVFRLERKLKRQNRTPRPTTQNRYIVSVDKVLDRPMRCIAVDSPSHLYLAGRQLIPTHNTDFLVGDAMQEYRIPSFRGLLLRESLGEMDQIGDRMERAYLPLGGRYRQRSGGGEWRFPSGSKIRFGYLQYDKDLGRYRGNPRSWIGIDESGLQPEKRVRTMIPWLSSVDKRLRVRMRLSSNPGGLGHSWQMAVFLRNRCPLHFPGNRLDERPHETSVWPGRVYSGASWKWPPSYAELVHMTTAFFPAAVTDNPLYDDEKVKRLLSQTQEIQMQLLHGCWCNAASLYFGFMRPEWMIPLPSIQDQWWWNHVISIDYGYGNSHAAAGRYAIDENGRAFGTHELTEQKMGAKDFAKKVCELWVKPRLNEERPRYLFVCMDSAMDQHHDIGESTFEVMSGVFAEYGIPCIKSHKNPADNAQVLYDGLANQHLVITDGMRLTFNAIATRVIDERRAVKKVHGDPDDDRYDSAAYFWNTWKIESIKPDYMRLQETLDKMRDAGADATAIARRSLVETAKLKRKETEQAKGLPLRGGSNRRR